MLALDRRTRRGCRLDAREAHRGQLVHHRPGDVDFVVTEVYKGQVAPEQRVVSVVDGASCGLELPGAGTVVVFAQSEPGMMQAAVDGATLYAYLCGGSRPLRDAVLPVSFGAPTAPTIAAAEPIRPFDTEPGLVHSDEQSLSTAVMAGVGLVILAAAGAAVLVIRRRHR